jgi:hypothetical protein
LKFFFNLKSAKQRKKRKRKKDAPEKTTFVVLMSRQVFKKLSF